MYATLRRLDVRDIEALGCTFFEALGCTFFEALGCRF
jgi:hypothetical protein